MKGRNAIVTGGSRGIGGSVALLLAKTGANVAIFGRNKNTLDDTVKLLPSILFINSLVIELYDNQKHIGIRCDVSSIEDIKYIDSSIFILEIQFKKFKMYILKLI